MASRKDRCTIKLVSINVRSSRRVISNKFINLLPCQHHSSPTCLRRVRRVSCAVKNWHYIILYIYGGCKCKNNVIYIHVGELELGAREDPECRMEGKPALMLCFDIANHVVPLSSSCSQSQLSYFVCLARLLHLLQPISVSPTSPLNH